MIVKRGDVDGEIRRKPLLDYSICLGGRDGRCR